MNQRCWRFYVTPFELYVWMSTRLRKSIVFHTIAKPTAAWRMVFVTCVACYDHCVVALKIGLDEDFRSIILSLRGWCPMLQRL